MDSLLTKVLLSTTKEYEGVLGGGTPALPVRELAPEYAGASPDTLDLIESMELLPWGFRSKSSHVYLWHAETRQRMQQQRQQQRPHPSLETLLLLPPTEATGGEGPPPPFDEDTKDRFYAAHPELRGLDTRGLLFAGSSVLHATTLCFPSLWEPGDVDIFMYGSEGGSVLDRTEKVLGHLAAAAASAEGGKGGSFTVKATRCVITVEMGEDVGKRKYQIVLREYGTPTDVLRGFDIGACQVGFSEETDGVICTEAAAVALKFRFNVFDVNRMSRTYVDRLHKYATRGFGIVLPFVSRRDLLLVPTGSSSGRSGAYVDLEYFGFAVSACLGEGGIEYTGALTDNLTAKRRSGSGSGRDAVVPFSSSPSPYGKGGAAAGRMGVALAEIGTMREACVYNERLLARNLRALRRREVGEFPGDGGAYGLSLVRRALFETSAPKMCQFLDVSFRPAYLQREGGALIACETGHRVHAMRGCDVASTIAELLFFLPGTTSLSRGSSRWREYFALRLEAHYRRTTTVSAQLDAPAWMGIRVPRLGAAAAKGISSARGEGEGDDEDKKDDEQVSREEIAEWIHQECKREAAPPPLSLAYGSPRFSYPTVVPAEGGSGWTPPLSRSFAHSTQFFQVRTTLDRVYRRRKQTRGGHHEGDFSSSSFAAVSPASAPASSLPLFGGSSAATLDGEEGDRPPSPCVSTAGATAAAAAASSPPCYSMYDDKDDGGMPRSATK